jgi:hypothetical protein
LEEKNGQQKKTGCVSQAGNEVDAQIEAWGQVQGREHARLKKSNQGHKPRKEQLATKTDSNTRENLRSRNNTKQDVN